MIILKGKKRGYCYIFPGGGKAAKQYLVEIEFDLTGVDADPEWLDHESPDPKQPNLRTVRHDNFKTEEEAKAYIAAWTPLLLHLFVSKPVLWWCFSTAVHSRGWMTKAGKAKWRRTNSKKGWLFAALNTCDNDWRHGITHEWLYTMTLWETHGRMYERGKWWEPGEAPKEVVEHYEKMKDVEARLESTECPAPIQKWYNGMRNRAQI